MLDTQIKPSDCTPAQALRDRFAAIRSRTEALCEPLMTEDYVVQPAAFASPPKWHLAHTSWFFEEMILSQSDSYQVFHPQFSFLFNSYYQAVGPRAERGSRGLLTRPSVQEVYAYRKHVNTHMLLALEAGMSEEQLARLTIGLNHEEQHQELLLTDLKYTLSCNPINPVYAKHASLVEQDQRQQGWADLPEGLYNIGYTGDGFAFDNELGAHKVFLPGCSIRKSLVTNREFAAFIDDGGYQSPQFWLDEGWAWKQANAIEHPLYWEKLEERWTQFTLGGQLPLNPNAAVAHVNFYAASAYAAWSGHRLPTEFEWEAACNAFPWGERWEWTASAYTAYPGFRVAAGALGEYNGKFMVNQMVLRGASPATAPGHSRPTYRNFFHPQLAWQYTGIRLAK